ncbi:hypothetical protein SEVIR_2G300033v4 [Setaria viridis]
MTATPLTFLDICSRLLAHFLCFPTLIV